MAVITTKTLAVAPMMAWSDRHCRAFHRTLTRRALLYTEMVTARAVLHGDVERLLGFDPLEHPVALQLGGADPVELAAAARVGERFGYDEINLNVGCPSDRVKNGRFGACLMREPELVADCVAAMSEALRLPVTVKCRIGVDEQEPRTALFDLVDRCAAAGARTFVVHARKAWLQGLSPKDNREVPPLDYALVRRLKAERPHLTVVLNGGLETLEQAEAESAGLDGVMLGRSAYHDPGLLGHVDAWLDGTSPMVRPEQAVEAFRPYLADCLEAGTPLAAMTRHMLGLFVGQPGARAWRRVLTLGAARPRAGLEVLDEALAQLGPARSPIADAPSQAA